MPGRPHLANLPCASLQRTDFGDALGGGHLMNLPFGPRHGVGLAARTDDERSATEATAINAIRNIRVPQAVESALRMLSTRMATSSGNANQARKGMIVAATVTAASASLSIVPPSSTGASGVTPFSTNFTDRTAMIFILHRFYGESAQSIRLGHFQTVHSQRKAPQ